MLDVYARRVCMLSRRRYAVTTVGDLWLLNSARDPRDDKNSIKLMWSHHLVSYRPATFCILNRRRAATSRLKCLTRCRNCLKPAGISWLKHSQGRPSSVVKTGWLKMTDMKLNIWISRNIKCPWNNTVHSTVFSVVGLKRKLKILMSNVFLKNYVLTSDIYSPTYSVCVFLVTLATMKDTVIVAIEWNSFEFTLWCWTFLESDK